MIPELFGCVLEFAPQRLHPRFSGLAEVASLVPGGLSVMSRLGGGVVANQQPADGDRLHPEWSAAVVAFPRTGSRFLTRAVELWSGGSVGHLHDIGALAPLHENGIPALVPLREPTATVVSWAIYNDDAPTPRALRTRLQSYVAWHRQLRRHLDRAVLVNFSDFITEPSRVLHESLERGSDPLTEQSVWDSLDRDDRDQPSSRSNLPSTFRQQQRDDFVTAVQAAENRRLLRRAESLYASLVCQGARQPAGTTQKQRTS